MARTYVTRREYDEWLNEAASLARALRYPITPDMVNDSAGIVFGEDQYAAFENGLWSREAYELMVIFESLNEPAVDGLPAGGAAHAEYSGLCDKLMIVHPGKFCPPHFHQRKTESYEVVLGEMEVFYSPEPVQVGDEDVLEFVPMPAGEAWPEGVALPAGREDSYARLTSYVRLRAGDRSPASPRAAPQEESAQKSAAQTEEGQTTEPASTEPAIVPAAAPRH